MPSGRPHELTPTVAIILIEAVKLGASLRTAAELAGKTTETLRNWRKRGEQDVREGKDTVFARFFDDFTRARAQGKMMYVKSIAKAAEGPIIENRKVTKPDGTVVETVRRAAPDTRASLQMLKIMEPDGYRTEQRVELSGPNGGAIPLEVAQVLRSMTDTDLDAVEQELDPESGGT